MSEEQEHQSSNGSSYEQLPPPIYFRPLTREVVRLRINRLNGVEIKKADSKKEDTDKISEAGESDDESPGPNPYLEQGTKLPVRMAAAFPSDMANIPLEDLDPFYNSIATFVIVTRSKEIFRFSATDALYLLSPFNPLRRVAVAVLTHGLFPMVIITTILANCYVMVMPASPVAESAEVIFTAIYTVESTMKVLARGFIMEKFTYLRDAWNWLDFVVILLAYVTMGINLGSLAALRTFRVLRALKTVAIVPGLKTIVNAVIESVKNLRDVIILTMFALSVFALLGLQIYMGVLTQKCIKDFPEDYSVGLIRDIRWHNWNLNFTNWHPYPAPAEYGNSDYPLCGNSSGSGTCPVNYTCLQGYGPNPNYGYTSFDSFPWAFLSAFRLMTQDFWDSLYKQILRTAGPWHMLFFIVIIFLGSYYLVNLILAIVAMSYDELQKKAEDEEFAAAEEIAAMKQEKEDQEARERAKAEGLRKNSHDNQTSTEQGTASRIKICGDTIMMHRRTFSLPGSPYRRIIQQAHGHERVFLCSHTDAQLHIPYVDDSTAGTPSSEALPKCVPGTPYSSYDSHAYRHSYTSHDFLARVAIAKEKQVLRRAKTLNDSEPKPGSSGVEIQLQRMMGPSRSVDDHGEIRPVDPACARHSETLPGSAVGVNMNDVRFLSDIIDQVAHSENSDSTFYHEMEELQEPVSFKKMVKQKFIGGCLRSIDKFCLWDCGFPWSLFRKIIAFVVFDAFTELFITLAIVMNTAFMAMDHYGLEENYAMNVTLQTGNKVFTTIFGVECCLKLMAMSPKYYFQVGWNVFDFVVVMFSIIEILFEDANLPGISALRSFRLLRVFKLAKSWPTLNLLISIMGKTMGALGNLVIVVIIIIFIFAVMGMQLFARNYFDKTHLFPGGELPRWNFTDFGHSCMIIFRVLCGEWIESMWDCMLVTGGACVPFFLATVVVGNLVVLNLFLALLLSSFGAGNLSCPPDTETSKLLEAFQRIARFSRWIKLKAFQFLRRLGQIIVRAKNQIVPGRPPVIEEPVPSTAPRRPRPRLKDTAQRIIRSKKVMKNFQPLRNPVVGQPETMSLKMVQRKRAPLLRTMSVESSDYVTEDGENMTGEDLEWIEEEDEEWEEYEEWEYEDDPDKPSAYPMDCMPLKFYQRFPLFCVDDTPYGIIWAQVRLKTFRLIQNPYFETVVVMLILLSSLALALEDVHLPKNPVLQDILFHMDRTFTIIFFFEMILKWLALGFVTYFKNAWCWLDFVIVMVSLINFIAALAGAGGVQAFKTMRTLRALRPLRAMSRMQGMRIVVNALVQAIPSILNVLLVCLIFWLIFAIIGVQLFNGKFHKCLDPEDGSRPDYRIIRNKDECLSNNYTWENSVMNFDHVGKAYLCLFQVATFKGWIGIMNDAIDSREIDDQPHRETNFVMYVYFVIFIIFGSFFTLNLFIGVIIDNFNEQKKKYGGSMEMFMTEDQKKYLSAMKKMANKKPIKAIPRPSWRLQGAIFDLVANQKFDMVIMLFIGLNMMIMTMDHYQMEPAWDDFLRLLNSTFVAIFTAECLLKLFALRHHYLAEPWNLFDMAVVFMSVAGMVLSDLIDKYFVSPTLLRVVRVVKVGRVLRLVKGAKGIRTLLFALAMSLPALFNICLLLFLVMFIFSIFGMSLFMNVKLTGGLDEVYNFQTFGQSIILLFQMSTSAGWDGVLDGIINEDDCEDPNPEEGNLGNCGSTSAGIAFLLSYLVISFLIIINMYIAVILENYSQATEEVLEGLTDDDYDMYYEIWAQFDPSGTQYLQYDLLSDFLDILEEPLKIPKPNKYKIISMDIPICKGDMMYCVDILDALTKDFFARKGHLPDEEVEISEVQQSLERPEYERISTTAWRQREEWCATIIQNAWRRYKSESCRRRGRRGGVDCLHEWPEVDEEELCISESEEDDDVFIQNAQSKPASRSSSHGSKT